MTIDHKVPNMNALKAESDKYCCSIAQLWIETGVNTFPEKLDLLELATKRCADLEKHFTGVQEELDLSNRKAENFRNQLSIREAEIERLRSALEDGQPLRTAVEDTDDRQADRLVHQLQMRIDFLQARNKDLDSDVTALVAGHAIANKTAAKTGTPVLIPEGLTDSSCQTVMPWPKPERHAVAHLNDFSPIRRLLQNMLHGRKYLMNRIDELVGRERDLLQELTNASKTYQKPVHIAQNSCHKGEKGSRSSELLDSLTKRIEGLEMDRQHWRLEARSALNALKALTSHENEPDNISKRTAQRVERSVTKQTNCRSGESKVTICRASSFDDAKCENNHLKETSLRIQVKQLEAERDDYRHLLEQCRNTSQRSLGTSRNRRNQSPLRELTGNSEDKVIHQLRGERDHLLTLLATFERQLHDIQSNIRVLTGERDYLVQQLSNAKKEILEARDQLVATASEGHLDPDRTHCHKVVAKKARELLWQVECQRDETAEQLRHMTTERDSLRDRLNLATARELTEKAHLLQRLEETEINLRQAQHELDNQRHYDHKAATVTTGNVEELTQTNQQMECIRQQLMIQVEEVKSWRQRADDKQRMLDTAQRNLSIVQSRLDELQHQYEKMKGEAANIRQTLLQLDQEKDNLQACLDERTERCAFLECEMTKQEKQLVDVQRSKHILEERVVRLNESVTHLDTDCCRLRQQCSRLQTDLQQTTAARDRAVDDLKQVQTDLSSFIQENQSLQAKLRHTCDQQTKLKECLVGSNQKINHLNELIVCKDQERCDLLKQYRESTVELDAKLACFNRLEQELSDYQSTKDRYHQEMHALRQHSNALEAELMDYRQATKTLESQCLLLTRSASESEDRVRRLQVGHDETFRELTETKALCETLEKQARASQHQVAVHTLEVDQLTAQLTESGHQLALLRMQVESEQKNSKNMEKVLAASNAKQYKTQTELQTCRHELQFSKECLEEKNKLLLSMEHDLHMLRTQITLSKAKSDRVEEKPVTSPFSTTEFYPSVAFSNPSIPPPGTSQPCAPTEIDLHDLKINDEAPSFHSDQMTATPANKHEPGARISLTMPSSASHDRPTVSVGSFSTTACNGLSTPSTVVYTSSINPGEAMVYSGMCTIFHQPKVFNFIVEGEQIQKEIEKGEDDSGRPRSSHNEEDDNSVNSSLPSDTTTTNLSTTLMDTVDWPFLASCDVP